MLFESCTSVKILVVMLAYVYKQFEVADFSVLTRVKQSFKYRKVKDY